MAKNKKKYRNEEKKEATTVVLSKIAKLFLSSKDQEAIKIGENVKQLVKDVGDLPPEIFEKFGAKLEKKLNELAPQNTDELVTRLEQLATKLEQAQPTQATTPVGLAGVHNTYKLDELNVEVTNLKSSTDELQQLQRHMQQSIEQVKQLNEAVQQTLSDTKKQTDTIQVSTSTTNEKSDLLRQTLQKEMKRVTDEFAQNIHSTNSLINQITTQLQMNGHATAEMKQQQAKQLQQMGVELAQKFTETSEKSNKQLAKMTEKFEDIEDELTDMKKQLKTPLDVLQGSVQGVNKELQQLKEVTAFLEQKAKESMQLVEATEDEAYVKEAADLVAVLVDRLSVGAQLYAKHRDTIEAMEQGEQEKAAWEIEKAQYTGANEKLAILTAQLKERDKEIEKVKEKLEEEKNIANNRVALATIEMFQNMANKTAIEYWPSSMQEMLKDENVYKHSTYIKGEKIDVTGEKLRVLAEYVELATHENGLIELTTSCYVHEGTSEVIQKAQSKLVEKVPTQQ